jgi:aminoglycoside phosphotransferase (APT) family kinase protein
MSVEDSGESKGLSTAAAEIVSRVVNEDVQKVEKIAAGVMTYKYQVTTATNARFIARFYPESRSHVVEYEPSLFRRCRTHGLRVPEVMADSRTGPPAARAYLVYRMLPGSSLGASLEDISPAQLQHLCIEIVRELKLLAALPTQGFGDLLNERDAACRSWHEFLYDAFDRGLAVARSEALLEVPLLGAMASIRRQLERFHAPSRSALGWGDLSPGNVIVDTSYRLVGFIDFEGVLAAEMSLGLGYLRARYGHTRFCAAMMRNWPPDRLEQPFIALYEVVRALRIMRHFQEPLPTGVPRDPINVTLPNLRTAVIEVIEWLERTTPGARQRS